MRNHAVLRKKKKFREQLSEVMLRLFSRSCLISRWLPVVSADERPLTHSCHKTFWTPPGKLILLRLLSLCTVWYSGCDVSRNAFLTTSWWLIDLWLWGLLQRRAAPSACSPYCNNVQSLISVPHKIHSHEYFARLQSLVLRKTCLFNIKRCEQLIFYCDFNFSDDSSHSSFTISSSGAGEGNILSPSSLSTVPLQTLWGRVRTWNVFLSLSLSLSLSFFFFFFFRRFLLASKSITGPFFFRVLSTRKLLQLERISLCPNLSPRVFFFFNEV